ncbi:MAG TPA: UDP-N-acetylmuramoyl-tripeptide--D-alanyl-D-alanine ligase [Candidatus Obscuribacterales bacterium]
MAAEFSAEEIIDFTRGRLAQGMMPGAAGAISTDTRSLEEGQWYLALSGERFDGHDFIGDAFARGALGCIVEERGSYPVASTSFPLIAVTDTLQAYHDLARNWRKRINPIVIGVTGSSGKTTTKEMCAYALSAGLRTHKSQMNENNEFGVPKTILSMPDDTQALVLEMAMRGLGQIGLLASTALPDVGIIVNVGAAHLGILETLDNIIHAKCELLEHLDSNRGVAVIGQPTDDLMRHARKVFSGTFICFEPDSLTEVDVTPASTTFIVKAPDERFAAVRGIPRTGQGQAVQFRVKAHGIPHLQDAWCAITAARLSGLDDMTIAKGLERYEPVSGRGNTLLAEGGALLVDESYNANPDSVRASVCAFLDERVFPQAKKYVVLGDLAELGGQAERLHRDLGCWLKEKRLAGLVTVGRLARHAAEGAQGADFEVVACQEQREAEVYLRRRLDHDTAVLIKGSHAANLDRLVSRLIPASVAEGF